MVVHSCGKTDFSRGRFAGGGSAERGRRYWFGSEVMYSPGGSLVNDRNNTSQPGATLKIDWRPEVKHRGRGRVEMACEVVTVGRMGLHGLVAGAWYA